MNKLMKMVLVAALMVLPQVSKAQTENPRGLYKLMTLGAKDALIKSPFDQYKFCTDSVTLTLVLENGGFNIRNQDNVFNYTGEEPQSVGDKSTLVYNSDETHFSEKWWSEYTNHIYFPKNDWCIENYEAGKVSDGAKPFLNALFTKELMNKDNPFVGAWYCIGFLDTLKGAKKQVQKMMRQYSQTYFSRGTQLTVFMPTCVIDVSKTSDNSSRCQLYPNVGYKKEYIIVRNILPMYVKRLSDNCMIVEEPHHALFANRMIMMQKNIKQKKKKEKAMRKNRARESEEQIKETQMFTEPVIVKDDNVGMDNSKQHGYGVYVRLTGEAPISRVASYLKK